MRPDSAVQFRILITAGPTHEPIDAVRYLANRSSGRLGLGLSGEAAKRGHSVRLLLGPVSDAPEIPGVEIRRFTTTADLQRLLHERIENSDLLLMAAAVADYRPAGLFRPAGGDRTVPLPAETDGKTPRTSEPLHLALTPTPDLLADLARSKRPEQTFAGFALEPRERLADAARAKLARKGVDVIVANPLETMDAPDIEARLFAVGDAAALDGAATPGPLNKADAFPRWLLDQLEPLVQRRVRAAGASRASTA